VCWPRPTNLSRCFRTCCVKGFVYNFFRMFFVYIIILLYVVCLCLYYYFCKYPENKDRTKCKWTSRQIQNAVVFSNELHSERRTTDLQSTAVTWQRTNFWTRWTEQSRCSALSWCLFKFSTDILSVVAEWSEWWTSLYTTLCMVWVQKMFAVMKSYSVHIRERR